MLISESIIRFDNGKFDLNNGTVLQTNVRMWMLRPHFQVFFPFQVVFVEANKIFSSFVHRVSCSNVQKFWNFFSELEFTPHLGPIRDSSVSKNKLDTWNFASVQGFCDINDHRIISIAETNATRKAVSCPRNKRNLILGSHDSSREKPDSTFSSKRFCRFGATHSS